MFEKLQKSLLRPLSIPGWVLVLIFLFEKIPIWHEEITFWSQTIVNGAPRLAGLFALLFSSAGQWAILLLGLGWIAVTAVRQGESKKPHFSFTDQSGGLYDLTDNLIGYYLIVKNDETRYQSTAHHVKATVRYKHHLGDKLEVNGVWITRNNTPRVYADQASLGMNESQCLLLTIWPNWEAKFYAPGTPIPPQVVATRSLEFGKWTVEVKLRGDNIKARYRGILTLVANQHPTWTPM
jgi:hypothetical protein